ncbi:hypothetical protein J6590_071339 [Homalodisca vitripennis]|nr:hypothetical protein J6590_071339 [Homalodisca vitripennis]
MGDVCLVPSSYRLHDGNQRRVIKTKATKENRRGRRGRAAGRTADVPKSCVYDVRRRDATRSDDMECLM